MKTITNNQTEDECMYREDTYITMINIIQSIRRKLEENKVTPIEERPHIGKIHYNIRNKILI